MDIFWVFWMLIGILFVMAVGCFIQPVIFQLVRSIVGYLWQEVKTFVYDLHHKAFGEPANLHIRFVPIDADAVNAPKNGWSFADCPASVWVRRKFNNTLELEVGNFEEKCVWYCYPSVDFFVGKKTGRVKKLIVKYRHIRSRGQWFRHSCGTTDWPKYFTSVVMAHLEVLKFSQRKRSHHPTLIGRIFKSYGENFFQEV